MNAVIAIAIAATWILCAREMRRWNRDYGQQYRTHN